MPKVTLKCPMDDCSRRARRALLNEAGSRGIHETCSEPAICPIHHVDMVRIDGNTNIHSAIVKRRIPAVLPWPPSSAIGPWRYRG